MPTSISMQDQTFRSHQQKAAGSNSESLYTLVDKAGYTIARGYKDYQKKQKIGQTDSLTTCDSNRQ